MSDVNQLEVPCQSYAWTVTPAGEAPQPLATGCQPDVKFATAGKRQITLVVTDDAGATGSSTRSIDVVAPPSATPPFVAILSPHAGDSLQPNQAYTLSATAEDPDGAVTVTGSWSFKNGATVKPIGTGNTISWTPGPDVLGHCSPVPVTLIFSASDPDGTSTDQIDVSVYYPPC